VPDAGPAADEASRRARYWRANLRVLAILLSIWFAVSFGLGILFVEPLDRIHVGGFPLGFWFSQQGSIYVFIVLIFVYARWMDRIDREYRVG
jgi:putative solute:sodium symporter small subunit